MSVCSETIKPLRSIQTVESAKLPEKYEAGDSIVGMELKKNF